MINDTKTIEKCKVNNCNLINVKEEFLIKIVVLILRLLLKYSNKDTSRLSRKVEKCINNILANNNDISRTINEKVIILDDKFIEKTILDCAILCKGSIRNTKEFLKNIYNYNCSTGKISNIITKYSVKARQYNESIDLSKITIGANDEIFQASKPVLVGVEPFSNYIYLMELEEKRDGITWWYHLEQKSIEQGLNLVKSVNDAGKGLNNGIKLSFDSKCQIWVDVFHSERNFSKGLTSLQNRAYSKIKEEYRNKKLYLKSKIDEKEYNDIVDESNKAIDIYDNCHILYKWFKEYVAIGGNSYLERRENMKYIIKELEKYKDNNTYLKKFYKFVKNNIKGLLMFVEDYYYRMNLLALKENLNPFVFKLMWKQLTYNKYSEILIVLR